MSHAGERIIELLPDPVWADIGPSDPNVRLAVSCPGPDSDHVLPYHSTLECRGPDPVWPLLTGSDRPGGFVGRLGPSSGWLGGLGLIY